MRHFTILALLAVAVILPSCRRSEVPGEHSGKPIVFVSILPQAYLAERIAGEHIDVEVLVGPGQNPHTYEPTPKQMTRLSQAKVFLRVGVPFEDVLLPKLSANAQLRVVDTRKGISLIPMAEHHDEGAADHDSHAGSAHQEHHGNELDPHIWMSVRLAKAQARTIGEALVEIDPTHKTDYEKNLRALEADLDRLDAQVTESLASLKGKTFFVFHPAFGYFAQDYGLRQEAVETGGKTPGPRHIKELIDRAKSQGVRVIFVQPQFSDQAAKTIAEQIGGVVVAIDPLSKDYIQNLQEMARKIREALTPTASPGAGT